MSVGEKLGKDMLVERLRNAVQASITEARKDPEFLGRIVTTVCTEFGLDGPTSMLIAARVKHVLKKKEPNAS